MKFQVIASFVVVVSFSGCASIVNGVNQSISVESRFEDAPIAGATCKLSSNKGIWFVTTPGTVTIHRGFQDLAVECGKNGFTTGVASIPSHVKPMAFGNIVFGGAIGVIVDSGDGAAFDYPDLISVDLAPLVSTTPGSLATPAVAAMIVPPPPVSSIEQPIANASIKAVATRETKYQVSAEGLAKLRACNSHPIATLTASGPGSETYTIPCDSGDALIARCEFGNCRAMQ